MSDFAPLSLVSQPTASEAPFGLGCNSRGSDSCPVNRGARGQFAGYLARLRAMPAIRHDLVASVRARIAAGTYETPEKFSAVLTELASDVGEI